MTKIDKRWQELMAAARKLGKVRDESEGDDLSFSVDPSDRVRVCDVPSETAEAYTEAKHAMMAKLVKKLGIGQVVSFDVGEKGHLEFTWIGEAPSPQERADKALATYKTKERAMEYLAAQGDREALAIVNPAPVEPEPQPEPEAPAPKPKATKPAKKAPPAKPVTRPAAPAPADTPTPKAERAVAAERFLAKHGAATPAEVAAHLGLTGSFAAQAAVATLTGLVKAGKATKATKDGKTVYALAR
jgi:hypothetical protein